MMKKPANAPSGAQIIDGNLVLSFPHAAEPVVWRMNLAQAQQAGFEIKESKGKFQLVQKSGAETQDIARFDTRENAVDALMDVSNALNGGPKKQTAAGTAVKSETAQWLIAIVGVLLVIGMFAYLSRIAPVDVNMMNASATAEQTGANPENSSGVPVSADDFLRGQ